MIISYIFSDFATEPINDIYKVDNAGQIKLSQKLISISHIIGLGLIREGGIVQAKEPYLLIARTELDSPVQDLKDFKIKFDKQNLINTLKKIKSEGNKVKIETTSRNTRTISVEFKKDTSTNYCKNSHVTGFEVDYFSIEYT
ncbi:hypothetical protein M4K87_12985 [Staphylococcus equorum]|uniref:hypothetical protein n=1 Tax=Staphylococcus equorum TaxID=246432 RepID=UPI002407EB41|nr:hypothetical protein [Staphylococcus equorum]MDG0826358.1 hypothetical protein [Staphylococcus equorum]